MGDSQSRGISGVCRRFSDCKWAIHYVVDNVDPFTHFPNDLSPQTNRPIPLSSFASNLFESGSKACDYGDTRDL